MKRGIIALVVVAVRGEVGLDAVSADISVVSNEALANDTVEGLVSSAGLA